MHGIIYGGRLASAESGQQVTPLASIHIFNIVHGGQVGGPLKECVHLTQAQWGCVGPGLRKGASVLISLYHDCEFGIKLNE